MNKINVIDDIDKIIEHEVYGKMQTSKDYKLASGFSWVKIYGTRKAAEEILKYLEKKK